MIGERSTSGVGIVAELATTCFSDHARLEDMIRASAAAGADGIALQKRNASALYMSDPLAAESAAFIDGLCKEIGIGWIAPVRDQASYRYLQQFNPDVIEFHPSTISTHSDVLVDIGRTFEGQVVVPITMRNVSVTGFFLGAFKQARALCLLQSNPAYPTPPKNCNVKCILDYRDLSPCDSRVVRGYASGDDGWLASGMAVAAGARLIIKRARMGADLDERAADLNGDFAKYVKYVRIFESLRGTEDKAPTASEHHKYSVNSQGS